MSSALTVLLSFSYVFHSLLLVPSAPRTSPVRPHAVPHPGTLQKELQTHKLDLKNMLRNVAKNSSSSNS